MKSNKQYQLEEEFQKIEKLLKDTEISNDNDIEKNDIIIGDESPVIEEDYSFPGLLIIRMDPMKMYLYMDLRAPINSDNNITINDIKNKVSSFGSYCYNQVSWSLVNELYIRIIKEGELISEQVIAKGKPVSSKFPEHYIIKDELRPDYKPELSEDYSVNFHKIHSFIIVNKGELIGDVIPEIPGAEGKNLEGKVIPYPVQFINSLTIGENVLIKNNRLFSAIDGNLKIVKNEISISPTIYVDSDVDYHTGDIDFNGDIFIRGSVRKDFTIKSGKDILIKETLEPNHIFCGNDLIVNQGIIGSKDYEIFVGSDVHTNYIEHATIKSHGSFYIKKSMSNSNIYSLDKIIVGEKGKIIGGVIYAQNSLVTGNLGNEAEIETKVILGIDFTIEEKLKKIQKSSIEIVKEMSTLHEKLQLTETRKDRDKVKYLYLTLKNRINSLNNYSRNLLSRLDKNDKSELIISGTIFPGTYIEICHISHIVKKKLSRVKFYLNKETGKIEWKNII